MKELELQLGATIRARQEAGINEFEGYSAEEIQQMLYQPFGEKSAVQLNSLSPDDLAQIPIFKQTWFILKKVNALGKVDLGKKEELPPELVIEIYEQGFIKDPEIEMGVTKLYRQRSANSIHLSKVLLDISPFFTTENSHWCLTELGKQVQAYPYEFFKALFLIFATKFNWGFFDGYDSKIIGQFGFPFTLILLHKYGQKERPVPFYGILSLIAFPAMIKEIKENSNRPQEDQFITCFSLRTFQRFLAYFGVIELTGDKWNEGEQHIKTTDLFQKMFTIHPPAK